MWLYYLLKTISTIVSWLPYKLIVKIGKGMGHLYYRIAKKQRIRAEETIKERLGYSDKQAHDVIKSLFIKLGITFMEIMYMPALNKDNIRGLVTFDRPEVLWDTLNEGKGVVMLACHMDNWEWLGAALALNGFPLSAVEKPQPNRIYSDFMNELREGVGQEIFSRGTSEILGCARAMKKGVDVLKPHLAGGSAGVAGKMIIGTVAGDLHDIGKNLVAMMIESAGFEVIDLGVDVPVEKFIEAVRENPDVKVVGVSALLTTTMPAMKETVEALNKEDFRKDIKIMVGGAPITPEFAEEIGADAYTADAASAAQVAKSLAA